MNLLKNLKSVWSTPEKPSTTEKSLPWLDLPNARQSLEEKYSAREISEQEFNWLRQWIDEGYFVVDEAIPDFQIDGMVADLEKLWYAETPVAGLLIHNLGLTKDQCRNCTHNQLISLDIQTRERLRDSSNWRIHEFYKFSDFAQQIFYNQRFKEIASLILGKESLPRYSINFYWGSGQYLHEDMAVFHVVPLNYLLGVWIAAEDIAAESGPLVLYPGSHRAKLYEGFENYPQTNLKTANPEAFAAYVDYAEQRANNYERKEFLAKKGQALFWHGMLLHGGGEIKNCRLTRKSFVVHFLPDGVDQSAAVKGPFNW